MENKKSVKSKRIGIVNKIIYEISIRGRKFFKYESETAYMFLKNGKVYMKNEWNGKEMLIDVNKGKPKHWHHGGTLMGLTKDFTEFINGMDDANGEHGYGGLFCPHWGYSEEDMEEIRKIAKQLEYLKH